MTDEKSSGVKVRLTLGEYLVDLEIIRDDLARTVAELVEEFTKRGLITKAVK